MWGKAGSEIKLKYRVVQRTVWRLNETLFSKKYGNEICGFNLILK